MVCVALAFDSMLTEIKKMLISLESTYIEETFRKKIIVEACAKTHSLKNVKNYQMTTLSLVPRVTRKDIGKILLPNKIS